MKHQTSRRTWRRIALFVALPLVLLACAAIVILVISSRTQPHEEIPVETRKIPSGWLAAHSPQSGSLTAPVEVKAQSFGGWPLLTDETMDGTLAIIGNGKQFGEESYELRVSSDHGIRMTSRGTFSVKVLFATVKAAFSQNLSLDGELRPNQYTLDINGPLGIGNRHVEGAVVGDLAQVRSDDTKEEIHIGTHHPIVLGTFSTYAFIPLLFRELEDKESVEFQVIPLMRGKGRENDVERGDQLIVLRVTREGDALIKAGSNEVVVDKYILTSPIGNSTLLAKGDEFLALVASSDKGSLVAYRLDYFPAGIDLP